MKRDINRFEDFFMMNNAMRHFPFLMAALACLLLSGCENVKEQVGLTKQMPDEFAVVKRAPLEMPPSYNLRPPQPGSPRPQEQAPVQEARQAVLGESAAYKNAQVTQGEQALLQRAGAGAIDPAIRQKVDAETLELRDRNKPVAQKLLGIGGDRDEISASVVNAKEEAARLKKNAAEGKPATEGATPTIEE